MAAVPMRRSPAPSPSPISSRATGLSTCSASAATRTSRFWPPLSGSGIDFVIARHEQAAAHAADGYARVERKAGRAAGARRSRNDERGDRRRDRRARLGSARHDRRRRAVLHVRTPPAPGGQPPRRRRPDRDLPAVRQASLARAPRRGPSALPRAGVLDRHIRTSRCGPAQRADGPVLAAAAWRATGRPPAASRAPRDRTSQPTTRAGSRRRCSPPSDPCIYVGGGLRGPDGRTAATQLAEHLDIPIVHSLMAKGTVPDEHPLVLGMPGFWGTETTNSYTRNADVVLAIGTRFAETDASSWDPAYTWRFPPSRLIQIDLDHAEIGRNYPVEIGVVADANLAATRIADDVHGARRRRASPARTARRDRRSPRRPCSRPAPNGAAATSSRSGPNGSSPTPRRTIPADAMLVTDVGWNKNGVAQCYPLPAAGRFITPGGAVHDGLRPGGRPRRADGRAGQGRCRADRRRRNERAAAGRADGGGAGPASDLPRDEQPRPRHDRRPPGGQLRRQLRLRVPRPGRQPVQPRLRGVRPGLRRRRLHDHRAGATSRRRSPPRSATADRRCSTSP